MRCGWTLESNVARAPGTYGRADRHSCMSRRSLVVLIVFVLAACRSAAIPDPQITEISIAREGGCNGYYTRAGSEGGHGPELMTGPCAAYTLVLTSDGRA